MVDSIRIRPDAAGAELGRRAQQHVIGFLRDQPPGDWELLSHATLVVGPDLVVTFLLRRKRHRRPMFDRLREALYGTG